MELRDAHRRHGGKYDAVPPAVGDVVLVEDEDKPQSLWKLARVSRLIVGRDGRPRGAVLHVPSCENNNNTLQRPLQRMYPVEVAELPGSSGEDFAPHSPEIAQETPEMEPEPGGVIGPSQSRPRRIASNSCQGQAGSVCCT